MNDHTWNDEAAGHGKESTGGFGDTKSLDGPPENKAGRPKKPKDEPPTETEDGS